MALADGLGMSGGIGIAIGDEKVTIALLLVERVLERVEATLLVERERREPDSYQRNVDARI